ncbi:DUF192 domain-containing protein [Allorhizobium undicola]|uniref:DUF192 domain-containing protein n=1 Tax=Allorhizobium undicola TaxID=78527 RepID=UPI003D325AE2
MKSVIKGAFVALFFILTLGAAFAGEMVFKTGKGVIADQRGGRHVLQLEYASSDEERAHGLMGRTTMAKDQGMIFDFGTSRDVMMWMKNTPLPLDMLFIDEQGVIRTIAANTKPFSEDIIPSEGKVRYVIELNGGRAAALGIGPGSRVVEGLKLP